MWEPLIHLGRGWTVFTIVCKGGYFISILWKCLPPITGHRPNSVTNSLLILNPSLRWLKHSFLVCRWEKKIKTCSIYLIEAQGISNKIMYKKKHLEMCENLIQIGNTTNPSSSKKIYVDICLKEASAITIRVWNLTDRQLTWVASKFTDGILAYTDKNRKCGM